MRLSDGTALFLKTRGAAPDQFLREAEGLELLAEGPLRVPRVVEASANPPFLLSEWIETGPRNRSHQETLGRGLAFVHQNLRSDRFGYQHDNFIGANPQPNGWYTDWCLFWRQQRLGFQRHLAQRLGRSDGQLNRLLERLLERLEQFLAEPAEPACLLHGDLWGGNVLADASGEPVLIDPAFYYGRREADLAMTTLFDGFERRFYDAYEEVWPLAPGAPERLEIYKLYHLLNHLNLFGSSYYGACLAILKRFV